MNCSPSRVRGSEKVYFQRRHSVGLAEESISLPSLVQTKPEFWYQGRT